MNGGVTEVEEELQVPTAEGGNEREWGWSGAGSWKQEVTSPGDFSRRGDSPGLRQVTSECHFCTLRQMCTHRSYSRGKG